MEYGLPSFNPCFIGSWFGSYKTVAGYWFKRGFNPCFIGSWFGSLLIIVRSILTDYVSILVLLEVDLEVIAFNSGISKKSVFQSLFYWKLIWKYTAVYGVRGKTCVSILVLLEVDLEVSFLLLLGCIQLLFQSLFYWKLIWKPGCHIYKPLINVCFNPCFIGSWFGRIYVEFP